jgi:hypothetical protein
MARPRSRVNPRDAIAFKRLLTQLPQAARDELADELDRLGDQLLASMKADVPKDTGALASRLSKSFSRRALRLRVGFVGKKAYAPVTSMRLNRRKKKLDQFVGKQFYGRFVEFGVRAQTVSVQRRRRVSVDTGGGKQARILRTESGRKVASDVVSTYRMKVKGVGARPFIFTKRTDLRRAVNGRLREIWDGVLSRASTGTMEAA